MKLTEKTRLKRSVVAAVLALLFAGGAGATAASALGLAVPALGLYLAAALAVALCLLGSGSGRGAALAALGFVLLAGGWAAGHTAQLGAIRTLAASWSGEAVDAARAAEGGRALMTCAAFALGALFFALLNRREFVSLAIMLLLAALVCCHAMSGEASLAAAVPALVAAAVAFALTGGLQREPGALRALVPAALAVALALLLAPSGHVTWQPLENAAERVRTVFEQYFRFTHERIAFSINEEGYDHAGELGDSVVSMLGGPAQPHTDPVMRVETDAEVLLRGAIRTAYTGYSWVDAAPKSRYLYYDLTHRATRDRVFAVPRALRDALDSAEVSVEMLDGGTSTLFVPDLTLSFSMDLSTAVYYNTAGEMFLSREVQPGDRYSLRALLPEESEALARLAREGEAAGDDRYQDILAGHTQLPEGIDGGVYALTMRVVEGADSAWDRAVAIREYLRTNMRYTLQPEMPPLGRDFVSHFLLDTQRGYCSYYATAMAVMGRIAGLPTRYVEGYLARPGREALTGEDAHAWAEVYFKGVGWIPFDATGGTTGSGYEPPEGSENPEGNGGEGDASEAPAAGDYDGPGETPAPSPAPEGGGQDMPTPSPEPDANGAAEIDPETQPEQGQDKSESKHSLAWLWMLLALLLVLAAVLAVRWVRGRLRATDPALLCGEAKTAREAALMLCRANLTVLAHLGQTPSGGETPEAFAERIATQLHAQDYADFTRAVTAASYGRRPLRKADVEAGLRAYETFHDALGRRERLRFAFTRLRRGLGDFEAIP